MQSKFEREVQITHTIAPSAPLIATSIFREQRPQRLDQQERFKQGLLSN